MVSGCSKDKTPDNHVDENCTSTISFVNQIKPLIDQNCIGCHGPSNSTGYTLTNHAEISTHAAAIVNAMRNEGGFQLMPQYGPALNDTLIQQFSCWINQGKMNN